MIGYIKGRVISYGEGSVLLENNGIGYEIACSEEVYRRLTADKQGEVYTYLAVREDGVSLYGFVSPEEKNMFLKLITVSGVGPKMGIAILSGMSVSDLAIRIATQDVKGLSSVKGLGKKTAERIILELREKVGEIGENVKSSGADFVDKSVEKENEDAIIALMSLGFTKAECVNGIKQAKQAGATTIQQVISYAIKHAK